MTKKDILKIVKALKIIKNSLAIEDFENIVFLIGKSIERESDNFKIAKFERLIFK